MALFGDRGDPAVALREHFPDAADPASLNKALTWGREVLDDAGVPASKSLEATAALRKADSGLALKPTIYLVKLLNGDVVPPSE